MLYHYYAFGLNIESEIECPDLMPGDGSTPALVVRLGLVPSELDNAEEENKFFQVNAGHFLLKIDQVARFLISGGCEIMVDPFPTTPDKDVRLFLLGSAMGALLFQRGIWPIHGGAIASENGAFLLVGASGSGKSTLVGAFYQRGFRVLTDDVCAITTGEDGTLQVWPAIPRIRLWSDSVYKLGDEPNHYTKTRGEFDKYDVPLQRFGREPIAIKSIYALYISDAQDAVQLLPLKGFEKIKELTINTYRLPFLADMQLAHEHIQQAQALARQARVVRVYRPAQPFLLDELVDCIRRDFTQ